MTFTRAERGWPPAIVAGAFRTGVLGVRALKRRSVRATCFDCNRSNPGFYSSYGPARLCPDPDLDSNGWLRFMIELAGDLGERAALIPSSDKFVSAIARHASELERLFILSPGVRLASALAEKQTQYELAAAHGMPLPLTRYVRSVEELARFAAEATFPCLLKPGHFREWQRFPAGHPLLDAKIAVADTPQRLLADYRLAEALTPNVVAQEVIQGDDSMKRVYLSCYDRDGRRIAHAMLRELRCHPLGFGPATVTEPIVDAEVDEVCDRFLRAIGYVGICEIEMKRDARDGRPKLIEANPRLSGSGDAAPYAGVDLCWLHYLDLIGRAVTPAVPTAHSFRHVVLRADACAIPAYRRAGMLSWRDVLRSYRPPLAFFDFDARDWRYSLETLWIAARLLLSGLLGRSRPRERAA